MCRDMCLYCGEEKRPGSSLLSFVAVCKIRSQLVLLKYYGVDLAVVIHKVDL